MSNKVKRKKSSKKSNERVQLPYEISYDAIVDQKLAKLPQNIQDEINSFDVNNRKQAKQAIERLLELKREYPKIPILYNYIALTYGFIDRDKQLLAIEENYQQNPGYLFARCHYAQLCLQRNEKEKVLAVFEHKLDIKSLYPRRSVFHISEFLAFSGVLCDYFYQINDQKQAQIFYQNMKEMAADAAETKIAGRYMEPGILRRLKNKLISVLVN